MKALKLFLLVSLLLTSCDRPASSQAEIETLRREIENLKAAQQAKAQPAAAPLPQNEPPPILTLPASPLESNVTTPGQSLSEPKPASKPRLAPEGFLYLTQRVSIPIEGGSMGLPPGTAVSLVSQDANGITIKAANGLKTVVQAFKVTNDMDLAEEIAANFAKEQREGAAARAQVAEQIAAREMQAAKEKREKEQAEIRQKQLQLEKQNQRYVPTTSLQRVGGG